MLKIACFNVNSINSRISHLKAYLSRPNAPDIICLQELKCITENFPKTIFDELGYNYAVNGQKTYNGVAIISKYPIDEFITKLDYPEIDHEQSRYIEAVISLKNEAIRIVNVYVPNGQDITSDKFIYKKIFLDSLYLKCQELLKLNEKLIVVGDFNVAPEAIDVYDPKASEGNICYHPEERKRLRKILNLPLIDSFRSLHPYEQEFSWWDYRAGAFQQNNGLRIDHILLSPEAADCLENAGIDKNMRTQDKPSDHAPVWVDLAV